MTNSTLFHRKCASGTWHSYIYSAVMRTGGGEQGTIIIDSTVPTNRLVINGRLETSLAFLKWKWRSDDASRPEIRFLSGIRLFYYTLVPLNCQLSFYRHAFRRASLSLFLSLSLSLSLSSFRRDMIYWHKITFRDVHYFLHHRPSFSISRADAFSIADRYTHRLSPQKRYEYHQADDMFRVARIIE